VDGILNINKPPGLSSAKVVSIVKHLTKERRVGHAGTLDPQASGVLPVGLGRGTRMLEFLTGAPKAYRAQVELGVTTATYDSEGAVTAKGDISGVTEERLKRALGAFCGLIEQTPPMYSALKYRGKRLYQLARAGLTVERKSRPVHIYQIELLEFRPPLFTIEVVSGKGTYIRSLAHDLGQELGCGAYLKNLVRLGYGIFKIEDAVSLSMLEDSVASGSVESLVCPIDWALSSSPGVEVSLETAHLIGQGRPVVLEGVSAAFEGYLRAYTSEGRFLAVLRYLPQSGEWQPEKVFC